MNPRSQALAQLEQSLISLFNPSVGNAINEIKPALFDALNQFLDNPKQLEPLHETGKILEAFVNKIKTQQVIENLKDFKNELISPIEKLIITDKLPKTKANVAKQIAGDCKRQVHNSITLFHEEPDDVTFTEVAEGGKKLVNMYNSMKIDKESLEKTITSAYDEYNKKITKPLRKAQEKFAEEIEKLILPLIEEDELSSLEMSTDLLNKLEEQAAEYVANIMVESKQSIYEIYRQEEQKILTKAPQMKTREEKENYFKPRLRKLRDECFALIGKKIDRALEDWSQTQPASIIKLLELATIKQERIIALQFEFGSSVMGEVYNNISPQPLSEENKEKILLLLLKFLSDTKKYYDNLTAILKKDLIKIDSTLTKPFSESFENFRSVIFSLPQAILIALNEGTADFSSIAELEKLNIHEWQPSKEVRTSLKLSNVAEANQYAIYYKQQLEQLTQKNEQQKLKQISAKNVINPAQVKTMQMIVAHGNKELFPILLSKCSEKTLSATLTAIESTAKEENDTFAEQIKARIKQLKNGSNENCNDQTEYALTQTSANVFQPTDVHVSQQSNVLQFAQSEIPDAAPKRNI